MTQIVLITQCPGTIQVLFFLYDKLQIFTEGYYSQALGTLVIRFLTFPHNNGTLHVLPLGLLRSMLYLSLQKGS